MQYTSWKTYESYIRSSILQRDTKIYLLHEDETIAKDISDWVVLNGSIEKNMNSGQCRSVNLTFINTPIYKKNVKNDSYSFQVRFNPLLYDDDFQTNVKMKITTIGMIGEKRFEVEQGIFVLYNPSLSENGANNTITAQLYDKFALLDGTISGDGEFEYEIPVGSLIYDAIRQLIKLPKNKRGEPFDPKPIIFPEKYKEQRLAYTIKKTGENAIGELIKEMCQSIGCDVRYNVYGNLEITDTLEYLDTHFYTVAWHYNSQGDEISNPTLTINRSQIKNRIIVVGQNINGFITKGIAENTNSNSLYSVNGLFGTHSLKIEDNLIPSNLMCYQRAKYELQKSMRNYIQLNFQSIWIPQLEPNNIIKWSKPEWGIIDEDFVVNSISLPINDKDMMFISATNLKEVGVI